MSGIAGGSVQPGATPMVTLASDPTSLARTASPEQITSFLQANPDMRSTVETVLASGGRVADLSIIVERPATAPATIAAEPAPVTGQGGVIPAGATTGAVTGGDPASIMGPSVPATTSLAPDIGQSVAQVGGVVTNLVSTVGQVVTQVGNGVAGLVSGNSTVAGQAISTVANVVSVTGQTVTQAGVALSHVVESAARPLGTITSNLPSNAQGVGHAFDRSPGAGVEPPKTATEMLGRIATPVADATVRVAVPVVAVVARPAVDPARMLLSEAMSSGRPVSDLPASMAGRVGVATDSIPTARGADLIATALREGRLAELIAAATKEGRLTELLSDARISGRLGDVAMAARSLDGVLAAFSAKGGLSATELAMLARSGLLSEADVKALRAAGVTVDVDVEEMSPLLAARDGPAETRLDSGGTVIDSNAINGFADAALACFDAGAIRIASREAFESYGLLGPPSSTIVAADAFEGVVREADGEFALIEQRLGLEPGVLADDDTLIALVDRGDLSGLRLATDQGAAGGWLPGGDKAGGLPSALADFGRGTTFREVTLEGSGDWLA